MNQNVQLAAPLRNDEKITGVATLARARIRPVLSKNSAEARTETDCDLNGNVVEVRSPRYFDTADTEAHQVAKETWTYTGRGNVATLGEAPGTAIDATEPFLDDDNLSDGAGLDSDGGLALPVTSSITISLQAARSKLADSEVNGGAGTTFAEYRAGSARVSINPAGEVCFPIADAAGRSVMSGSLDPSDNSLISWNGSAYDATELITGYTEWGQLASLAYNSTTIDTRTYDDGGRMTGSSYKASGRRKFTSPK